MICRDDSDIVAFDIDSKKSVKVRIGSFPQKEITGQVLVIRIRFDNLVAVDCPKYFVSRDVPTRETHIDMVCPIDASLLKALLDESNGIARNIAVFGHHVTVWRK
jgi:hypothetical protein